MSQLITVCDYLWYDGNKFVILPVSSQLCENFCDGRRLVDSERSQMIVQWGVEDGGAAATRC